MLVSAREYNGKNMASVVYPVEENINVIIIKAYNYKLW